MFIKPFIYLNIMIHFLLENLKIIKKKRSTNLEKKVVIDEFLLDNFGHSGERVVHAGMVSSQFLKLYF